MELLLEFSDIFMTSYIIAWLEIQNRRVMSRRERWDCVCDDNNFFKFCFSLTTDLPSTDNIFSKMLQTMDYPNRRAFTILKVHTAQIVVRSVGCELTISPLKWGRCLSYSGSSLEEDLDGIPHCHSTYHYNLSPIRL